MNSGGYLHNSRQWSQWWTATTCFYAWHLTFEDTAVPGLVGAYHRALEKASGLELVPLRWLHLTLHGVGLTGEVPAADLERVVGCVARRLASVSRPIVTFDGLAMSYGVISLMPVSAEPVHRIRAAVRRGMVDALGRRRVREPAGGFEPHISIAFATVGQPAAPVAERLRTVSAKPVPVLLHRASLLAMYRQDRAYQWRRLADASLR